MLHDNQFSRGKILWTLELSMSSLLTWAGSDRHSSELRLMLRTATTAADIIEMMETRRSNGQAIIHICAEFGCIENLASICHFLEINNLLENYVEDRCQNGMTPLHYAAKAHALNCIKFLVDHKANVMARNRTMDTPLHLAAQNFKASMLPRWFKSSFECITVLVNAKGMDMCCKNNAGLRPLSASPNPWINKMQTQFRRNASQESITSTEPTSNEFVVDSGARQGCKCDLLNSPLPAPPSGRLHNVSQSALFGLPTPPDTVSTATDASLTAKRIAFCWNDEPLKHVVPLFDEHGQGANRSASARLMYRGHFHVPIGAGSTMERFECVIKTAFYAEGELPCEEDLASIQRECEVYALLREGTGKNNKNGCVTCHAADPEYRYLVLEHYGRDLRALLETQIKFPSAVVEAIATAVAALHEHGIMHGDIKPQNILYTFSDAEGYVMKLCDLDSAHRVGDTCAAAAVGTEGYFSPELCQARRDGTTITAAVEFDLFSLGLVLWQVLERSIASPLPAASAPGDALSLCYRDQNYLWGKLAMGAGIKAYTPAVRELTHLEPQHRMSSRQLCIFLQKQSQPYLHQELQRVIDENAKLLQDKSFLQNSVHNKLDAIRRDLAGQLTEMTDMLHTLIQGTHNIPTLAVIVPEVAESSFHFFENPMHLIKNHFRLYFLCSHTHQVAHCGPAKKGYEITVTREWVKKAAPVIRTGLLLLKLAAMAGGLPIPIPDISPLLQDANKHSEYLAAALCLVENPLSDSAPATLKLTKVLKSSNGEKDSLGAVAQHGAGDTGVTLEENSLKAYDTIQGVLTEKGVDISSTCGLRKVTCKGKTAWVLDDDATERQFRESLTN